MIYITLIIIFISGQSLFQEDQDPFMITMPYHMIRISFKLVYPYSVFAMAFKCSIKSSAAPLNGKKAAKMDNSRSRSTQQTHCLRMFMIHQFIVCLQKKSHFCFNSNLDTKQDVLLTHGDSVSKIADGFKVVGTSQNVIVGMSFII